jgi:hypothetical protein
MARGLLAQPEVAGLVERARLVRLFQVGERS